MIKKFLLLPLLLFILPTLACAGEQLTTYDPATGQESITKGYIDANDDLGLGEAAPAGDKLYVVGDTGITGDLTVGGTITGDVTGALTGNASTATALETARTIAGVSFDGTANIDIPSTGLSDTANLLYETELDDFSELQAQISDKTLVNEEDAATWDSAQTFSNTVSISSDLTLSGTGTALFFPDDSRQTKALTTASVGPTELQSTAVTAGSYTLTSLTVDADGRLTAASSGSAAPTDKIQDTDQDTKVQTEESADEDKIRFDTNNVERLIIGNAMPILSLIGDLTLSSDLTLSGTGMRIHFPDGSNQSTASDMSFSNTRFKIGSFERDTTAASGTQTVSGVGFKPALVIFLAAETGSAYEMSIGFDTETSRVCINDAGNIIANYWGSSITASIYDEEGGPNWYHGKISSMNSDGFVVSWTKVGTETSGTLYVNYVAFR